MRVNVLPSLLGKYYQLLQTQLKLVYINLYKKATLNNLTAIYKIYKKQFSHI
jgi:hypothetical protein